MFAFKLVIQPLHICHGNVQTFSVTTTFSVTGLGLQFLLPVRSLILLYQPCPPNFCLLVWPTICITGSGSEFALPFY